MFVLLGESLEHERCDNGKKIGKRRSATTPVDDFSLCSYSRQFTAFGTQYSYERSRKKSLLMCAFLLSSTFALKVKVLVQPGRLEWCLADFRPRSRNPPEREGVQCSRPGSTSLGFRILGGWPPGSGSPPALLNRNNPPVIIFHFCESLVFLSFMLTLQYRCYKTVFTITPNIQTLKDDVERIGPGTRQGRAVRVCGLVLIHICASEVTMVVRNAIAME